MAPKAKKKSATKKNNSGFQLTNDFMETMRDIISGDEGLGKESGYIPAYSTGLKTLDFRNGRMEDGEIFSGIDGGKICYIIGNSGTGKTTLTIDIACSIADTHERGSVFHFDCERSSTRARIRKITGWSKEKFINKYFHLDKNVTTESFFKLIKAIANEKLENRDKYEYPIDKTDDFGNQIYQLPPTVFILDSLATLIPGKVEERDELGGQMDATAAAKANTAVFKGIMDSLISANITLLVINHINTKVDINPMAKSKAQVNFLKQDETLVGGKAPVYLSNTLIKLDASTKLDPSKDYGIKGFMVKAELIKSRSNAAGNSVTIIFDQQNGFSDVLSSWQLLKERKVISGSGHGYYLPNCPDVKVKQKDIVETYNTNAKFREALDELVEEELMEFLTKTEDPDLQRNEEYNEEDMDDEDDVDPNVLEYDEEHDLYWHPIEGAWYDYQDGTYVRLED